MLAMAEATGTRRASPSVIRVDLDMDMEVAEDKMIKGEDGSVQ